ncbi:hypothetical protein O6H91_17G055700 [Diphasiastrum complanatum]|uniref:Uncharacterized protein n=1 Tax=Diphasiastrum complanatum TaxID=34168 RepID=A0ACC2B6Y8_DIPCM|nr:hypothetical protein O6H91_17G055700 [Diphasiastrum complanatum]
MALFPPILVPLIVCLFAQQVYSLLLMRLLFGDHVLFSLRKQRKLISRIKDQCANDRYRLLVRVTIACTDEQPHNGKTRETKNGNTPEDEKQKVETQNLRSQQM